MTEQCTYDINLTVLIDDEVIKNDIQVVGLTKKSANSYWLKSPIPFDYAFTGQSRVCPWLVGGAAAGAGLLAQSQPRARQHPERKAGFAEHDQLFV